MESIVVNARVPAAKKELAKPILERIGASTTELINSAYDYLIAEGQLPTAAKSDERADSADFQGFLARATLEVDWGDDLGKSYKELIAEGKRADYESLA